MTKNDEEEGSVAAPTLLEESSQKEYQETMIKSAGNENNSKVVKMM